MDKTKYLEIFKAICKSRIFQSVVVSSLIFLNFILAGVELNFSFILIVLIFSYLAVTGILFRKSEKPHKVFTLINLFIVMQKLFAYLLLLLIIAGIIFQVYFKYLN